MKLDLDRIAETINGLWDRYAGVALLLAGVALLLLAIRVRRQWRRRDFSGKASLGFAAVQAGITYAVVIGVYEFFAHVLGLPTVEAVVLALFIEAATWAAVGFIAAHAKQTDPGGKPREGFGPAGPFFWVAVVGGGTLAVLGSSSTEVAIGRAVIVTLGAYMWWLRLAQIVTRPERTAYAWTWTPTRLLQAIGAVEPRTDDAATEHDAAREHQVRRLARSIRWANSGRPWCWLGRRELARRAETLTEDVIGEARRRWAVAHVLRDQSLASSPTMAALVADVERATVPGQPEQWIGSTPEQLTSSARKSTSGVLRKRASRRNSTGAGANAAERIRAAHGQSPELTQAELARQVGVSDRYVRQVLSSGTAPTPTPEQANGHGPGVTRN